MQTCGIAKVRTNEVCNNVMSIIFTKIKTIHHTLRACVNNQKSTVSH